MRILPVPKRIKTEADAPVRAFAPTVEANGAFAEATAAFQRYAQALCGLEVRAVADGAAIRVEEDAALAAEAYRLVIDGAGVRLFAADPAGANHAFATLLQLLQADAGRLMLPEAVVEDQPDAGYRGLMVDLARCWHPLSYLLSYVDMCYYYKLSVLHLHFTDDESYTLPSRLYPKLSTPGRAYTRGEIRALVEYAHSRGVQLMPEIDVPGHCKSFQAEYGDIFGTKGVICQHEKSIGAMKALFAELCDMFPYSRYAPCQKAPERNQCHCDPDSQFGRVRGCYDLFPFFYCAGEAFPDAVQSLCEKRKAVSRAVKVYMAGKRCRRNIECRKKWVVL